MLHIWHMTSALGPSLNLSSRLVLRNSYKLSNKPLSCLSDWIYLADELLVVTIFKSDFHSWPNFVAFVQITHNLWLWTIGTIQFYTVLCFLILLHHGNYIIVPMMLQSKCSLNNGKLWLYQYLNIFIIIQIQFAAVQIIKNNLLNHYDLLQFKRQTIKFEEIMLGEKKKLHPLQHADP